MLFPLYWMTNASLQPRWALLDASPRWLPIPPMTDGYQSAFASQGAHIATSFGVAGAAALLSLIIAAPCAYALAIFRMRWLTLFVLLLLIAQMIPHIVMANALYAIYARIGLLDSYGGLVLADSTMGVPFAILILRAFMVSLPRSLVEAALVRWRGLLGRVLPHHPAAQPQRPDHVWPVLLPVRVVRFHLRADAEHAPKIVPITLGIYDFIGTHGTDWNAIMATAVLASIPPIMLLLLGQKYIAAGLIGGAVKE